jgi:hypothetical protein
MWYVMPYILSARSVSHPRLSRVGTPYPLFIYCETPPVNYLFIVRHNPQHDLIIVSIVIPGTANRQKNTTGRDQNIIFHV